VKGLTKSAKFSYFLCHCKFSSILHRTPNSEQGGRFCTKYCARRIAESWHPYVWHCSTVFCSKDIWHYFSSVIQNKALCLNVFCVSTIVVLSAFKTTLPLATKQRCRDQVVGLRNTSGWGLFTGLFY